MTEFDTYSLSNGDGEVIRWLCWIGIDEMEFVGCGPTEAAAKINAFEQASQHSVEAEFELGILLGKRGDGKGGRPNET